MINNLESWFRNRKILITGGLGFIGSNLSHRLLELGAAVTVFDHMSQRSGRDLSGLKGIEQDVKVVVDDIRNVDAVRRVVAGVDVIFNLAGQVSYTDSMLDPRRDFDASCVGHLTLL